MALGYYRVLETVKVIVRESSSKEDVERICKYKINNIYRREDAKIVKTELTQSGIVNIGSMHIIGKEYTVYFYFPD